MNGTATKTATSYEGLEGNVEHSGEYWAFWSFGLKKAMKFSNSNFVVAVLALVEIASTHFMKPYKDSTAHEAARLELKTFGSYPIERL